MKKFVLILFTLFSSHLALASQHLIEAARDGNIALVTRLIAENDGVNDNDSENYTALILAALNGHDRVIKILLACPETLLNHPNKYGSTALMLGAGMGHIDVVQALLVRPEIMINHANKVGETALIWAAREGYIEVVHALLARPEIIINHANIEGKTASMMADDWEHLEIAQLIADTALARSEAHLLSPKIEQITELTPELSDVITNYLTGLDDPRNLNHPLRALPFYED